MIEAIVTLVTFEPMEGIVDGDGNQMGSCPVTKVFRMEFDTLLGVELWRQQGVVLSTASEQLTAKTVGEAFDEGDFG
jgi:hypothetical protein